MKAILDTHALFWYLTGDNKLSATAKSAIESYETVIIPTIVLLEAFEICFAKNRVDLFDRFLDSLPTDTLMIYPLDSSLVKIYTQIPKGKIDMHDRIILATAKSLDLPIITKDRELSKIYLNTIWSAIIK